jgi:hypothetical protein
VWKKQEYLSENNLILMRAKEIFIRIKSYRSGKILNSIWGSKDLILIFLDGALKYVTM